MDLAGKTVVITGAASGIGRALGVECARRGASVALADIDLAGVLQTKTRAETDMVPGARCSAHEIDVASLLSWQTFQQAVISEHIVVDGVINNAGVTFSGRVEDTTYAHIERVMSINFMGMVYGSKEFLPMLKTRPEAFIANVSSVFGLYPMKRQAAYCASKFAIRGFTEVLAQELRSSQVLVASVHPGHIGTNIVRNAHNQGNVVGVSLSESEQIAWVDAFKAMGLAPQRAAEIILDGVQKKKRKIIVGRDAVRGERFSRWFPSLFVNAANDASL